MKRTKTTAILPPVDLSGAESVMAKYAKSDARLEQLNAQMDEQFAEIRAGNAKELQQLQEDSILCFKQMQMFAESNPDLFPRKKGYQMSQGLIGFRTGTPKLKTAKGFTWASVLEMLKVKLPKYVKTVEAPIKDKLLADRENSKIKAMLPTVGLEVVQDETFFVELKKEELQPA